MKEKKNLKKIFSIIGIVAIGIYLFFYLITSGINLFSNLRLVGFTASILSSLWTIFKNIVIYGFMCFYLIYEMIKKSDKHDKVFHIILFVAFCIIALSSFIGIINKISTLVKVGHYLNGIKIVGYIVDILNNILKIGLATLFGINTMGLVVNKKLPTKILTFIIWGLLALILINSVISIIITLIGTINARIILVALGALINSFALSVAETCLAFILYDKSKSEK